MSVVKLELDRERALREVVRVENFLKRTPPNIAEALRELEGKDGLAELLKNAPLVSESPLPPPPPPPPPPPVEEPPAEKPFRVLDSLADWKGQHWPSRSGAIVETEFAGRRAIHMSVTPSDHSPGGVTETTRAQLETDPFINEGEVVWTRGRFFLPPGFEKKVGSWGVNIVEVYFARGDGSPPWQIQARGSRLECRSLGGNTLFWSDDLSKYIGRWVTYAYGSKTARDGSSWLELHVDDLSGDHPAIPRRSLPLGSFSGAERFIIQCYYATSLGSIDLYHENEVVFGRSLASVR